MKYKLLVMPILFVLLQLGFAPPLSAQEEGSLFLPTDPQPSKKTVLELTQKNLALSLYEDHTLVKGVYHLVNPTEKAVRATLWIPVPHTSSEDPATTGGKPYFIAANDSFEYNASYNIKKQAYSWEITLEPNAELDLSLTYKFESISPNKIVFSGYHPAKNSFWAAEKGAATVTVDLNEIHPAMFSDIRPRDFHFQDDTMVWKWNDASEIEDIFIKINLKADRELWEDNLSGEHKTLLRGYLAHHYYLEAAALFRKIADRIDPGAREPFRIAQAYYLKKAGNTEEAKMIWLSLYEDEATSPIVYWEVGHLYSRVPGKLLDLYDQARELQVHPLIQGWLAAQIPSGKIKPARPEISLLKAELGEGNTGYTVSCNVTDPDGDIETIILEYNWEDGPVQTKVFQLQPYQYEYFPLFFIPAADRSMQRLYYEFKTADAYHHQVTTGNKDVFFLSSQLSFEIPKLRYSGANLVLGDYAEKDRDELARWFNSYLRMVKETRFIPLTSGNTYPYIVFLGKPNSLTQQYGGPFFFSYTPAPFNFEETNLQLHRYFLSSLYGKGWQTLPQQQLEQLGNALMLGKGSYVLMLKYLQDKKPNIFYGLLVSIGEGKSWSQALQDLYGMTQTEVRLRSMWYAYGSFVFAFVLIVLFAWLGKTGYLVRFIQYIKARSS